MYVGELVMSIGIYAAPFTDATLLLAMRIMMLCELSSAHRVHMAHTYCQIWEFHRQHHMSQIFLNQKTKQINKQ